MDVAQEHRVNFSEPRVIRPSHGAARIVKNPRTVRILENHGPVELAEFAVMAAQRRNLDVGRVGRLGEETYDSDDHCRQDQIEFSHEFPSKIFATGNLRSG